ncbi:hypothetical protein [Bartonella doshiae]|uniref:hypothetical protein n=1 Tax=Bartonella doshiae TaxID=33044 RepID=UPI000942A5F6|nr:hypothetical protein [Bartonella doshiae]
MLFFKKAVLLAIVIIGMLLSSCAENSTQTQSAQINNQTGKAAQSVYYQRLQAFLTGMAESDPYGSGWETLRNGRRYLDNFNRGYPYPPPPAPRRSTPRLSNSCNTSCMDSFCNTNCYTW